MTTSSITITAYDYDTSAYNISIREGGKETVCIDVHGHIIIRKINKYPTLIPTIHLAIAMEHIHKYAHYYDHS